MEQAGGNGTALRIGPAGWSYEDWIGTVYPHKGTVDQLLYIASRFNAIELNSSFYRVPGERLAASWARRLSHLSDFQFSVKVLQVFTHGNGGGRSEARSFIRSFEPLLVRDRIGAFLLQFPWSFKNTMESRERLTQLAGWFRGQPVAVELRHGSWNTASTLNLLGDLDLAFCNIDQPVIGDSIPPTGYVTNDRLAYIRLHGRNHKNWFASDAGRDERYDYLYDETELGEWSVRASGIIGRVQKLFIVTNNHFRGQALVNAFQLRNMLEGGLYDIPEPLKRTYPVIGAIATPSSGQLGFLDNERTDGGST
jgi:uncharacterized protein YecE (DUF72 family)